MKNHPLLHYKHYPVIQAEIGQFKPDLFILHGLFGSGGNWHNIAESLNTDRNVYTVDLRNHGDSFWKDSMSYTEMAEDVQVLLDHLNVTDCVLMGHSMGGKVAMQLTQLLPGVIQRCIIVDIAPRLYPAHHQDILGALQAVNEAKTQTRSDAQRVMTPLIRDFRVIAFLLKSFKANQASQMFMFNVDVIAQQYVQIAAAPVVTSGVYPSPILFISGTLSSYIQQPEDEMLIHSLFTQASIRSIADAGHWVHAEKKDTFIQEVSAFLV